MAPIKKTKRSLKNKPGSVNKPEHIESPFVGQLEGYEYKEDGGMGAGYYLVSKTLAGKAHFEGGGRYKKNAGNDPASKLMQPDPRVVQPNYTANSKAAFREGYQGLTDEQLQEPNPDPRQGTADPLYEVRKGPPVPPGLDEKDIHLATTIEEPREAVAQTKVSESGDKIKQASDSNDQPSFHNHIHKWQWYNQHKKNNAHNND